MKRRRFIIATGSTTLATGTILRSKEPTVGLEFELSGIPSRDPSRVNSLLIEFSTFELTPQYLDKSKNITIETTVTLSGIDSETIQQSVDISDKTKVTKSDLSDRYSVLLDSINTDTDVINGNIDIKIKHDSIGEKIYSKDFTVQTSLLTDLVSYYPAEKSSGKIVHDAKTNYTGYSKGATFTSDAEIGSYSLDFNPSNSEYVDIGNRPTLKNKGFTISAWVYPRDVSTYRGILVQRNTNNDGVWLGCSNGSENISFYIANQSGNNTVIRSNDNKFNLNEWHHVVATYDGEEMRLYRDANLVASENTTIDPLDVSENASIGANKPKDDEYWDGKIDDIRIYKQGFTQSDVDELYSLTTPSGTEMTENKVPSQSNNGVSYYPLNSDVNDKWSGYNGTDNAGSFIKGAYQQAKSFNQNNNDLIRVSHDSNLDPGIGDFSVSTWVRIPVNYSPSNHRIVIQKAFKEHFHQSDGVGWGISVERNGNIYFRVDYNDGNGGITSSSAGEKYIADNLYHHVVAVRENDTIKFYVDGSKIDETTLDTSNTDISTTADMTFGATEAKTRFITADIDETRIYDDSLSPTEITRLFNKNSYLIE